MQLLRLIIAAIEAMRSAPVPQLPNPMQYHRHHRCRLPRGGARTRE